MRLQLHMWGPMRSDIIALHDFHFEQIKTRVLAQFSDISGEADKYADEVYENLGRAYPYDDDMSAAAESAMEHGQERYSMLYDLKMQVTLSSLTALYHHWEKTLRAFIDRELNRDVTREGIERIWKQDAKNTFGLLQEFGWDVATMPFFQKLDACRLIVNAFKHGKGPAFNSLKALYPQYLQGPLLESGEPLSSIIDFVDYTSLAISSSQFEELAGAIRQFWVSIPERLFYESN